MADPRGVPAGVLHTKAWQIAMIGLGTATTQLDTAVNIAFPAITRGFDLAIGDIQWVVICYVLAYASLLLALGRIGDTIGHAIVYRTGLICSAVAFLLVGYAPSYGAMLAFRCLQGIGAALVLSCGAALVTGLYGEERRSRALGIYTMMMAVGLMLGPLLGGALVANWDWPAVFWFRIPIAIAALLLLRGLPASPPRAAREAFDIPGGIALVLGLVTMLMAFNRIREFSAVWLGLLSALAFAGFILRQSRAARPIIDFAVFRLPGFAILNLVSVLANLAAFSVWLLVPYYLTRVTGYSLGESGAILASGAAGAVLAAPVGGRLIGQRMSAERLALAGAAGIGAGLVLLERMDRTDADGVACRRADRPGHRPRPVPARLYRYRDGGASAGGSRGCRQPCAADADARYRGGGLDRADGVRNPACAAWLLRRFPPDFSAGGLAGVCQRGTVGALIAQDRQTVISPG